MGKLLGDTYAHYLANQTRFWVELSRHLTLSGSALAISLILRRAELWATRSQGRH